MYATHGIAFGIACGDFVYSRQLCDLRAVQKLVSNMVIRAATCIGLSTLTDTDVKLYGPSAPVATPAGPGQVPRLDTIHTTPMTLAPGVLVPRPVLFLPVATIQRVLDAAATQDTSLLDLAEQLQRSEPVYGALMPPGAYDLARLFPQRYVQQRMLYSAAARRRLDACAAASDSDADTITALLQVRGGKLRPV
jgi:hypothetical protein